MPVKWDNEDDPCFHKTAALEFEEAELPASDNTTNRAIALLKRFVEVINEHDIGQKTLSLMSDTQEFLEEIAQRH